MSAAGTPPSFDQAFATLRQFARAPRPAERCELCSAALAHQHPHLVEIRLRQIVCACEACATLFDGMAAGKYRRVSRRAQLLANFQMADAQWENLLIPINMAFFFQSSVEGKVVALYPSPAGAVESLLPLDAWNEIVQENAILSQLQPDIEALLVNSCLLYTSHRECSWLPGAAGQFHGNGSVPAVSGGRPGSDDPAG